MSDDRTGDALIEMNATIERLELKVDRLAARIELGASDLPGGQVYVPSLEEIETYGADAMKVAADRAGAPRFQSFTHQWNCTIFNVCTTAYMAVTIVIDPNNGSTLSWNAIETAVKLSSDNDPIDFNHKGQWYKYQAGGTHARTGWNGRKDGRDVEIWGRARFYYANGGWVGWRWFTRA